MLIMTLTWDFQSRPWRGVLLTGFIAAGVLLGGCPEDPMGPDNRLALIAFGRCQPEQALHLTDLAIKQGDAHQRQRAWMLKAAILRDSGDLSGAQALYPELEAAWMAVKKNPLQPSRRERDIRLLIDIAYQERRAHGLPGDCARLNRPQQAPH